jgi:hypothetical protein
MRYAAKLLFEWKPDPIPKGSRRRFCEERVVVFRARSPESAVKKAATLGRHAETRFDSGHRIRYRGIVQCMELGPEADKDEVWWEFRRLTDVQVKHLLTERKNLWVFTDRKRARRGR